jgi:hypothetical protein
VFDGGDDDDGDDYFGYLDSDLNFGFDCVSCTCLLLLSSWALLFALCHLEHSTCNA